MIEVQNHIDLSEPHFSSNYHHIIWASKGLGEITVNNKALPIRDNTILTTRKNQAVTFATPPAIEGFKVCFQDDDFPHSSADSVCRIVILYNHINLHNLITVPSDSKEEFEQLFSLMHHESRSSDQQSKSILSLLLQTLLLKIEKVIREHYLSDSPANIFEKGALSTFMENLEGNYTKFHKVQDYAELMAISSRKLNDIVKHYFDVTAKELITTKLYVEIAARLQFGHESIKEIAYQLGFSSPYHLSHFFNNIKGISPQAYRESVRK